MASGKRLTDHKSRQDHFAKKARQQGYVSRAAFKLEEIDKKYNILKRGQRVIDLGCRPGAWLQYAASKIAPEGYIIGIDRRTDDVNKPSALIPDHSHIIEADIRDVLAQLSEASKDNPSITEATRACFQRPFDVVLSDMAPDLSGIKLRDHARMEELLDLVLDIAVRFGSNNCYIVAKTFMMPDLKAIENRYRQHFPNTKVILSKATREKSSERYIVSRR